MAVIFISVLNVMHATTSMQNTTLFTKNKRRANKKNKKTILIYKNQPNKNLPNLGEGQDQNIHEFPSSTTWT
jgi:hypothetical protein